MHDAFVQVIRYKLQKRVRRLNSADYQHFPMLLRVFFHFFDNSPILSGVRDELLARVSEQDVPATVDRILKGQAVYGTTEAESAAMGYCFLKKIAEEPDNDTEQEISAIFEHQESATTRVSFLVLFPQFDAIPSCSLSGSPRTRCDSRSPCSFRSWGVLRWVRAPPSPVG